jgi:hypothetical protein
MAPTALLVVDLQRGTEDPSWGRAIGEIGS